MRKAIWVVTIIVVISGLLYIVQSNMRLLPAIEGSHPGKVQETPLAVPETYQFAVPVLMYHHVDTLSASEARDQLARDLTVSPEDFEAQLGYLRIHGYTFITTDQIVAAVREQRSLPVKAVALTFDDGYLDNFTVAFPLLQRYHAPATIFLVASTIGTPKHLDWYEIVTMRDAGIHIESHCLHHDDLTRISPQRLNEDLSQGKAILEAHTGSRISELAYPSGRFNSSVIDAVFANGYTAAWGITRGFVTPRSDLACLPRIRIRGTDSLKDCARKLHNRSPVFP